MKTLTLIITLMLGFSFKLGAQFFITIEPMFARPGILYNYKIERSILGIYSHAWFGNIKGEYFDGEKFYTDNIKAGLGISFPGEFAPYFGVNYNYFFNTKEKVEVIDLSRIKPISFEIGVSAKVNRFTILFMEDFINWESMIGISYKFKVKPCSVYYRYKGYNDKAGLSRKKIVRRSI